jgi:hypothetical protein
MTGILDRWNSGGERKSLASRVNAIDPYDIFRHFKNQCAIVNVPNRPLDIFKITLFYDDRIGASIRPFPRLGHGRTDR